MANSPAEKTLTGVGNLLRHLPTGTVFLFQFLNPILTNSGHCQTFNKSLSLILIVLCALSCFFSSFTDSYTGDDGLLHCGIVTFTGLWPAPASKTVDLSVYKLRAGDFVHATFTALVFAVLVVLDSDTVECFFPAAFAETEKMLIQVLPPVVGAAASVVFVMFPNTRHGIGYCSAESSGGSTAAHGGRAA